MWNDKPAVAAALLISCGTYAARVLNVQWYFWGTITAACLVVSLWTLFRARRAGGRETFSVSLIFSPFVFFRLCIHCRRRAAHAANSHQTFS